MLQGAKPKGAAALPAGHAGQVRDAPRKPPVPLVPLAGEAVPASGAPGSFLSHAKSYAMQPTHPLSTSPPTETSVLGQRPASGLPQPVVREPAAAARGEYAAYDSYDEGARLLLSQPTPSARGAVGSEVVHRVERHGGARIWRRREIDRICTPSPSPGQPWDP